MRKTLDMVARWLGYSPKAEVEKLASAVAAKDAALRKRQMRVEQLAQQLDDSRCPHTTDGQCCCQYRHGPTQSAVDRLDTANTHLEQLLKRVWPDVLESELVASETETAVG